MVGKLVHLLFQATVTLLFEGNLEAYARTRKKGHVLFRQIRTAVSDWLLL